jgi:hypothetical protein
MFIVIWDCVRLCVVLSSSQSVGFETSICWRVEKGDVKIGVQSQEHGKVTCLVVISFFR